MKLLIDIPEHIYEHAKETTEDSNDEFDAMRAIANGTQQESSSENPNTCGDAISRQAAIRAIEALQRPIMREESNYYQFKFSGMSEALGAVENLPSVMPQQRTGRWIEHDFDQLRKMGYYRCSECNIGYQRYERGERKSELPNINGQKYELHRIDNYCPNCGAKMEVEE